MVKFTCVDSPTIGSLLEVMLSRYNNDNKIKVIKITTEPMGDYGTTFQMNNEDIANYQHIVFISDCPVDIIPDPEDYKAAGNLCYLLITN